MERTERIFLVIAIIIFAVSACNAQPTQTEPTSAPSQIIEPVFTQSKEGLPLTEAEVPRVSVEEAKAAPDSGAAVIVDVRSPAALQIGSTQASLLSHRQLGTSYSKSVSSQEGNHENSLN